MFEIGDIVQIFAPQAGHNKYHLCISVGAVGEALTFLYLNSNPNFEQTFVCDCSQIPCLPASDTGKTAFTFAMLPRYNEKQLKLYKAKKLGALDAKLAAEIYSFATKVNTMTGGEKKIVLAALELISKG